MANQHALNKVFMALADETRRHIIHQLTSGEKSVSELTGCFNMSMAAVSKHIKVLEEAHLIGRRKDGRTHYLHLQPEYLTQALDWISLYRYFWKNKLQNLNDYLQTGDDDVST